MRWSWFLCGVGFLLLAAYLDNVRGPLLPVLASLMRMDYGAVGLLLVVGNLAAMTFTWFLMPLTNRYSLRRVSLVALGVMAGICVLAGSVSSPFSLYILGALAGGILSVMGTLSNLYAQVATDVTVRGRAMSALHAVYGIGSFFAPLIAAEVLHEPEHWQWLYFGVLPVGLIFALWIMKEAPSSKNKQDVREPQSMRLEPIHWLAIAAFVLYVAGETLASMWMTAWFTTVRKVSLQEGARYASIFFVCMTGTRLACSFWIKSHWARPTMWGSLIVAGLCFFVGRVFDIPILIPMIGLVGPFFPLFVSYLTVRFPERDRTLVIWLLAAIQGTLAAMNFTIGHVADSFGMDVAYWLPLELIGACMVLLAVFFRWDRKALSV